MAQTSDQADQGDAAAGGTLQGSFAIHKIYVKDVSFETPNSPEVFQEEWQPSVNMDISNGARLLDEPYYEVVLTVTVTVAFAEKTVYLAEVQQAGIFHIEGFDDEAVHRLTGTACPNILFPFAREMVSDLVIRGGFPQLLLAPVNFEALYLQQQQQQAEQPESDQDTKH
jgi:preprotein translocase subunit SecB